MRKVELFEEIRRQHFVDGKGIRELARQYGVHRRMVRQAISSAIPPRRKTYGRSYPVLTEALQAVVNEWLEGDRGAPRKQRHTARRVWQRLGKEHGFVGSESTVRRYVRRRKRELAIGEEVFVPQVHLPGQEAEIDWWEATVEFEWGAQIVKFFSMRACASGREFVLPFVSDTQDAFIEGHVEGFAYFGGVFARLRYDNLTTAVKKVLRGRRRKETDRFVALRSHYLFEAEFCRPGKQGAHEKGGVEGGLGRFRRTHLVPVPKVANWKELENLIREKMGVDDDRRMSGHQQTVNEAWCEEKAHLRALPSSPFSLARVRTYRVDAKSRVHVHMNHYSVPVCWAHRKVEVRVSARHVNVWGAGQLVASHRRLYGRYCQQLELDHYLDLLWQKPGAFAGSRALAQARMKGRFPASHEQLWQAFKDRHGHQEGTRQMVEVLWLHRQAHFDDVDIAIGLALEYGCMEASAVEMLLRHLQTPQNKPRMLPSLGVLSHYERPALTDLGMYDALLTSRGALGEVHS